MTKSAAHFNPAGTRASRPPNWPKGAGIFFVSPTLSFIGEKKCRCRLRCAEEFRRLDYNAI